MSRRVSALLAVLVVGLLGSLILLRPDVGPTTGGASPVATAEPAEEPDPLVDPDEIVSGGPPPDGIPPLDDPRFVPVSAVDWLAPAEPVAVLQMGGEAKAYPVQILVWHEIVNDSIGGVPVAVTYCPLCNTAISFRRPVVEDEATTFGTSGKLYNSNLVMYDRATESLWPQALGQAVTGELTGQRLERVATQLVSWADFRSTFPDGLVLSRDTGHERPYGQNPYPLYDREGSEPFLFTGPVDGRLEAVDRVLGLSHVDQHLAVPYARLTERSQDGAAAANLDLAGIPVVVIWRSGTVSALDQSSIAGSRDVGAAAAFSRIVDDRILTFSARAGQIYDDQTGSTWDPFGRATAGPLAGTQLPAVTSMDSFWFDWAAFHPETDVW